MFDCQDSCPDLIHSYKGSIVPSCQRQFIRHCQIIGNVAPDVSTYKGVPPLQIPFEDALSFHERIAKSDLVLVDGADHKFSKQPQADTLIQHTIHFLTTGSVLAEVRL